jgi:hypothetical protein
MKRSTIKEAAMEWSRHELPDNNGIAAMRLAYIAGIKWALEQVREWAVPLQELAELQDSDGTDSCAYGKVCAYQLVQAFCKLEDDK